MIVLIIKFNPKYVKTFFIMAQRFVNFFLILIFIFSCNSDEDSIAITKNNEY
jgi:hypothetical protein